MLEQSLELETNTFGAISQGKFTVHTFKWSSVLYHLNFTISVALIRTGARKNKVSAKFSA